MTRHCPICDEPLEALGVVWDEDRNRPVDTFRCCFCGEDFLKDLRPPAGWRADVRAAVRTVLALPDRGVA